jgi:hypothetical protein
MVGPLRLRLRLTGKARSLMLGGAVPSPVLDQGIRGRFDRESLSGRILPHTALVWAAGG